MVRELRQLTSLQHPLVKHLVKLRQNHDYRIDHQSVVVEGIKPVTELCQLLKPKTILAYDESFIPQGIDAKDVVLVNESIMQKVSGMIHPEGILAEAPLPPGQTLQEMKYIIALDGINDPGNLGSLLRTALALGWEGAFILGESCDPFNEKAIRAARGATFRIPLRHGTWDELKDLVQKNKLTPVAGDVDGTPLKDFSLGKGVLLVLGNEARGLSEEAAQFCQKATIPMPGEMESLNVGAAGAILMYVLRQRQNSE